MAAAKNGIDVIRKLEESLLIPKFRVSAVRVAQLLAEEFVEFGSSGRTYTKTEIVSALARETPVARLMREFRARTLVPGVILATYRVSRSGDDPGGTAHSLHSSIWKRFDGRWQMVFHQGTPAAI